jgi:CheY-like chemotaxis protein
MADIVKLISDRKVMFESFAKSKHIKLIFTSDHQNYITAVDEAKMEKIIDNLISNAVKYSHPESHVHIDVKCDHKKWVLKVKDQGIGISRKEQRRLFKEFYRSENAINSKVVGSGIGLLLVKNYVTMHGGDINCTSQENVGSTFQVVVPYKVVPNSVKTADSVRDLEPASEPLADNASQIPNDQGKNRSAEMKILIVEDNDDLRNFMYRALHSEFKVLTAENGAKAWEVIPKQMPDLVVSDIMMPDMDGFDLCKLMKSTYETSHIPIILLTALSEKTEQLYGLGLGADDYLTKPFDMGILKQRIKMIIRNREAVREKAMRVIKGSTAEPILANELNDKFVKKMLEVARVNIPNSAFDKEEFASSMNVSPSLLYKKVKALTGLSPTDFIKTVRLDHALELLQTQKFTVTEVSEVCGFTSAGYFSTVFRKHFGKSPTEI